MLIDLNISAMGASVRDILATAQLAEELGFAGVTVPDELLDVTTPGAHSHEAWTLLSAIAARTSRVALGALVLNVANRDAGTTAVAAATLQELSGDRLWLGLGAGAAASSPFAADQHALGRPPPGAAQRRSSLVEHLGELRRVWGGGIPGPAPLTVPPPLVVGAFGPLTAALAGRFADGIAAPVRPFGPTGQPFEALVARARGAHIEAERPGSLLVVAHYGWGDGPDAPQWRPGSRLYDDLLRLGTDRVVISTPADPCLLRRVADHLPREVLGQ